MKNFFFCPKCCFKAEVAEDNLNCPKCKGEMLKNPTKEVVEHLKRFRHLTVIKTKEVIRCKH